MHIDIDFNEIFGKTIKLYYQVQQNKLKNGKEAFFKLVIKLVLLMKCITHISENST